MSKLRILENRLIDQVEFQSEGFSFWTIADADPIVKKTVNEAIEKLPERFRRALLLHYYQGLSYDEIGREFGLTAAEYEPIAGEEIKKIINRARALLRAELAEFVSRRWKIRVKGGCRICRHPQAEKISRLLQSKPDSETWGEFAKRLKCDIGEQIQPPQILIAHLKHMQLDSKEGEVKSA